MPALLLFLVIVWIVTVAGLRVAARLRLPAEASPLERGLIAWALGLGLLAYGMLVLGLAGLLTLPAAAVWLFALALFGGRQHGAAARHIAAWGGCRPRISAAQWAVIVLSAVFGGAAVFGVYTPPSSSLEWDSISYHLADPKLYILAHRIYYLPWESHSNFAFTAEMWYTLALLLHSAALAKWFHFGCGVGMCLTVYALGARFVGEKAALWAAALLVTTPLIFWEAGTAYVDLATAFFATITLLCVMRGVQERQERWLWAGAVLMGLTLSTKATALSTLALLAGGMLLWRLWVRPEPAKQVLRSVAVWCLLAVAVGSPWYIKSTVLTGNPIYPFYYRLFGGRYWSATNAGAYNQSNADFGVGRQPVDWLLSPWNLTMNLLPGHPIAAGKNKQSFNDYQTPLMTLSPVLLAALFFPFLRRSRAPRVVIALALYALGGWLLWFATAQHVRYLLPILPVLCLLAGWILAEALAARSVSGRALAALAGCSAAFSLYVAAALVRIEAPVVLGFESPQRYLSRHEIGYGAAQFVNTELPKDAKIVLYGDPLGYYFNRPYLWGEQLHSNYIPYGSFHSAEDMRRYLQRIGVTDILVNVNPEMHYFTMSPNDPGYTRWVYDLTAGSSAPLFSDNGIEIYALPAEAK